MCVFIKIQHFSEQASLYWTSLIGAAMWLAWQTCGEKTVRLRIVRLWVSVKDSKRGIPSEQRPLFTFSVSSSTSETSPHPIMAGEFKYKFPRKSYFWFHSFTVWLGRENIFPPGKADPYADIDFEEINEQTNLANDEIKCLKVQYCTTYIVSFKKYMKEFQFDIGSISWKSFSSWLNAHPLLLMLLLKRPGLLWPVRHQEAGVPFRGWPRRHHEGDGLQALTIFHRTTSNIVIKNEMVDICNLISTLPSGHLRRSWLSCSMRWTRTALARLSLVSRF